MKPAIQLFIKWVEEKRRWILFTIIAFILLGGAFYSFYLGDNFKYFDERMYYELGRNIVSMHMYSSGGTHPTANRPPGYPFLIAFFISIINAGIPYIRFLNFIALGLCACLIYFIGKRLSSEFAGVLGASLVIGYPVLFYMAGTVYPQIIGALIFLTIVFLLLKAYDIRKSAMKIFFVIGLLLGFLIITIPSFVLCLPIIFIWIIYLKRKGTAWILTVFMLSCLIAIAPWTIRNYALYHAFIPISSNGGYTLLYGNCENTVPDAGAFTDISKYTEEAARLKLNEAQSDSYYKAKALEFIMNNKAQFLKSYFLKLLNYFNYRNKLATETEMSAARDTIMLIVWGTIILIFFIRLACIRSFAPSVFEMLLIVFYFASAFFHALFLARIRYRLPFDFLIIIIVSMFITNVLKRWAGSSGRGIKVK